MAYAWIEATLDNAFQCHADALLALLEQTKGVGVRVDSCPFLQPELRGDRHRAVPGKRNRL
jgi:hypothetical protein